MKIFGFWLLLLLAVFVPATATIAGSIIYPTVSVAKQGQVNTHAVLLAETSKQHGLGKLALHGGRTLAKVTVGEKATESCCDATPCSQCASCSTCAAMLLVLEFDAAAPPVGGALPSEPGVPRAEFLLAGQERPPRHS